MFLCSFVIYHKRWACTIYCIVVLTVSLDVLALGQKRNVGVIDVEDVSGVHLRTHHIHDHKQGRQQAVEVS